MGAKIAVSLASRILAASLNIILTPIYIKMIGIESYGIIGVYIMLLCVLQIFDLGLTQTITRETAHLSAQRGLDRLGELLRTFEALSWTMGLTLGCLLYLASPLLADHWVKANALPDDVIRKALGIMAMVLAVQWPIGFYTAGLVGMQQQGRVAVAFLLGAALRSGGAVLVLWLIEPSIEAFFIWQIIGVSIHTLIMKILLWRSARTLGCRPRFCLSAISVRWRLLISLAGIGATSRLADQMDKVVLSQQFNLEMFGYYTLAWTIAGGLEIFVYTIHCVLFPRLCEVVSHGNGKATASTYHYGAQILCVGVLPASVVIAVFSPELLMLWTRDPGIVAATETLVRLLVIVVVFEGLLYLPDGLQTAFGWTRFMLISKGISAVVRLVMLLLLARGNDLAAVAAGIAVLNGLLLAMTAPYVHRKLLGEWRGHWFLRDVLPVLGVSLLVALCWRGGITPPANSLSLLLYLAAVSALCLIGGALAVPATRPWVFAIARGKFLGELHRTPTDPVLSATPAGVPGGVHGQAEKA